MMDLEKQFKDTTLTYFFELSICELNHEKQLVGDAMFSRVDHDLNALHMFKFAGLIFATKPKILNRFLDIIIMLSLTTRKPSCKHSLDEYLTETYSTLNQTTIKIHDDLSEFLALFRNTSFFKILLRNSSKNIKGLRFGKGFGMNPKENASDKSIKGMINGDKMDKYIRLLLIKFIILQDLIINSGKGEPYDTEKSSSELVKTFCNYIYIYIYI